MGIIEQKTILTDLTVKEAMRRQVIRLDQDAGLDRVIARFIKYKVNALLITGAGDEPAGVVSKTDVMGAYYAELPLELPAGDIMISPPLYCGPDDTLETALERMREHGVYRLFVRASDADPVEGILAYPDIVGLLYKFCHECRYSKFNRRQGSAEERPRFTVKEVMTPSVQSYRESDTLTEIMEGLSAYRFGAVLIRDDRDRPTGVVSKSDLVLAYKHGVDPSAEARTVMSSPVRTCEEADYLEAAIRTLIFSQIQRIFVRRDDPERIVGVLSLSDAARIRSGSCQACVSSRIKVDDTP
ncbi:MAG: cyclic nucleotide-binding/CBS domain-containing protein [Thermodesulfobacteriota bacterium]